MNQLRVVRLALPLVALAIAAPMVAQQPATITIRAVTPASAISPTVGWVDELIEIAGGKVLVNDGVHRELEVFDSTLRHPTILSDTLGTGSVYPRIGKLIRFTADSSLFYESDGRALDLLDPQGKFIRVLALPRPQDFNMLTSGAPVGTDAHGHLIYQGRRPFGFPTPCRPATDALAAKPSTPAAPDSVVIIRADFETRTVDTVGWAKASIPGVSFPITTGDANCSITSAKVRVNPSIPPTDSWTVTAGGAIAIVRSHDYHIDWINADGTTRSTAKMPFDWRRLTDADKQAKIDSARHIVDSLTAIGGYRLKACAGGRTLNFNVEPPDAGGDTFIVGGGGGGRGLGSGVSAAGGGGVAAPPGRGPNDCQTVTVTAEFVPVDSMADYIAPIREESARADLDGNVWILPATSAGAKGGLLYDVVNPAGEIVERVQLPGGRAIAGFGRNGVLYLSHGDYKTGFTIEKVKVVR